jgi:hypothetical protein
MRTARIGNRIVISDFKKGVHSSPRFACEAGTPCKSKDKEMPNIRHRTLNRKTCQGISVNIPSSVSVIEAGANGPSSAVLGPTVMMKVG